MNDGQSQSKKRNDCAVDHIYAACLEDSQNEDFPQIMFYRAVWTQHPDERPTNSIALKGPAYYFRMEDSKSFIEVEEPPATVFEADGEEQFRLDWVHDTNCSDALASKLKNVFMSDGLKRWRELCGSNAYGILDEKTYRDGATDESFKSAIVNECVLYLVPKAKRVLEEKCVEPRLFMFIAGVIRLQDQKLWRVRGVTPIKYAYFNTEPSDTQFLSLLGKTHEDKPIQLISNIWIVEHCAQYADELTRNIVTAMLDSELKLFCDRARGRISDNLHRFTYGGNFKKRTFENIIRIQWLKTLMGGCEDKKRNEFYDKISQNTSSEDIKGKCTILTAATAGNDEEQTYDTLVAAYVKEAAVEDEKEKFLFLFDFLGRNFVVGLPPEELPAGDSGDVPRLDAETLDPVLLRSNHEEKKHLGMFYKRVATVRAKVRTYVIADGVHLRIADYLEDVTKSHLLDYNNGLLKSILRARTPFHERRLLQLLGVPCRQAVGDVFHKRMDSGLHPIPQRDGRTFQSRDDVVFEEVKKYISLQERLRNLHNLEDLEDLLLKENVSQRTNLVAKMAILQKIATYKVPITNTPLANVLGGFADELNDQGHALASRLCTAVKELSGENIDRNITKNECMQWVFSFWKEMSDCFPDHGPNWTAVRGTSYERAQRQGDEPSMGKAYTLFVLAAVFDRQITTFYDPPSKYVMPYDAMVWAVNSVHRLHMLSALLQICCGDWACTPGGGNILSRRLLWSHHLAATAYPGRAVATGDAGRIPEPAHENKFFCHSGACWHLSTDAALWGISQALGFEKDVVFRILQKIGWWFNGLLNEAHNSHFRCRCGAMMAPRRNVKGLNWFSCPHDAEGHNKDVYLSWCIHSYCSNVIDSRIDSAKCDNNHYICKKCGSCCKNHMRKHQYNEAEITAKMWVPACRACSREMANAWEALVRKTIGKDGGDIYCMTCKTVNHVYPSLDALWRARAAGTTSDRMAIQWDLMDQYFEYNIRPVDHL